MIDTLVDLFNTAWTMAQVYGNTLDAIQVWDAAGFIGSVAV